jgi:hypothetical protein
MFPPVWASTSVVVTTVKVIAVPAAALAAIIGEYTSTTTLPLGMFSRAKIRREVSGPITHCGNVGNVAPSNMRLHEVDAWDESQTAVEAVMLM